MQYKIWILSVNASETCPGFPRVMCSETEARKAYDEVMREDWVARAPYDTEMRQLPYPGDPDEAAQILIDADCDGTYFRWELSSHVIFL